MTKKRVLVGDDQLSVEGSLHNKSFIRAYGHVADFDFESNLGKYIDRARVGNYDALLIDLDWNDGNPSRSTGLSLLHKVRDYAPIRLLHTSHELNLDLSCALKLVGATGYVQKHRASSYLQNAIYSGSIELKGGERE